MKRSYLQIKVNQVVRTTEKQGNIPNIEIFAPALNGSSVFETSEPEIFILGAVTDNGIIESVNLNSDFLKLSETGQFMSQVKLFPGENTITIGALDNDKNYEVKRFIINYVPVIVSLAEKVRHESKFYALIIGINTYPDPSLNSLENPLRDAQKLYDVLVSNYTFEKVTFNF